MEAVVRDDQYETAVIDGGGRSELRSVLVSHFVLCTFVGLFTLEILMVLGDVWDAGEQTMLRALPVVGLLNGLLVAMITALVHRVRSGRERAGRALFYPPPRGRALYAACVVGFACGVLDLLLFAPGGVLVLTVFTLLCLLIHLRRFLRTVVRMLGRPEGATWLDVGELLHVYATVLAAFTMMVIALVTLRVYFPSLPQAFAYPSVEGPVSFIDALYFSIVVMTTLGFGDIHPLALDAKMLVALQCLVSYFMFALMVGSITRGVVKHAGRGGCAG